MDERITRELDEISRENAGKSVDQIMEDDNITDPVAAMTLRLLERLEDESPKLHYIIAVDFLTAVMFSDVIEYPVERWEEEKEAMIEHVVTGIRLGIDCKLQAMQEKIG